MARALEPCQAIERSIITKYRKTLWRPFVEAVKRYALIQAGDRIAVCISGAACIIRRTSPKRNAPRRRTSSRGRCPDIPRAGR